MVCIPCIVIPFLLWLFHKYIQPLIMKFWRPSLTGVTTNEGPPPPPPGKADSEEYCYIYDMITTYPVVVFGKTTCKFSTMAKDILGDIGVSYHLANIDHRDNMGALQDMFEALTGARTVPRVFVGGKCVGGGSDLWSLHNQGNLMPMLKAAGANFKKDN